MCEVLTADGSAHPSNGRAMIDDDDNDFWFGFEQEYFLWDTATNKPLGFPEGGFPGPQGPYYCGVGANNSFGRNIVEEHLDATIDAGLNVKALTPKLRPASGNFRFLQKALKKPVTKSGSHVIYWKE